MASVQRKIVHKQFNSPIALYSDTNIKATLDRELRSLGNGVVGWVLFIIINFFLLFLLRESFSRLIIIIISLLFYWVCVNCCTYTLFTQPLCTHWFDWYFFPPPSTFTTLFIHLLSFARYLSANFFTFFFIEHWLKNSIDVFFCVCVRCVRDGKWWR